MALIALAGMDGSFAGLGARMDTGIGRARKFARRGFACRTVYPPRMLGVVFDTLRA